MLERITYKNHVNEVIEFGKGGIYVNESDLHDFTWNTNSKNNKISSFNRKVITKSLPVVIACTSKEDGIAKRNRLFEVMEKDVLANKHGRITSGDYYLKCYVTGSKKSDYLRSKRLMIVTLTITTDLPYWIKETVTTFGYGAGSVGKNLDFNNDFPYDYASELAAKPLNNTSFVPCNFRMNIYGPCVMPKVTIAGHEYGVSVTVAANEYLQIDSINKTIVLTHTDGTTTNCFNLRQRDFYIFEKMPVGVSNVTTNTEFKFDITLLEERSEPKWT